MKRKENGPAIAISCFFFFILTFYTIKQKQMVNRLSRPFEDIEK